MLKTYRIDKYLISVCFASQIGLEKQENQDSIFFGVSNEFFALSVCDGLGSAPLSATGSASAAKIMVEQLLSGHFEKGVFKEEWLKQFPEDTKKYNTTAKFVLIGKEEIRLGGIGDGVIAVSTNGAITEYANHGDFSNQTSCIFDLTYDANFKDEAVSLSCPSVIMISTDGFSEDIKEDGLEMLMNAAGESLQNQKTGEEFDRSLVELLENWPNPTNGDDKTVAFILVEEKNEQKI